MFVAPVLRLVNLATGTTVPWVNSVTSAFSDFGTSSSTVGYGIGMQFALTDLPSYSEFVNLYNEYQLEKIVMVITPLVDLGGDTAIGGQTPDCWWVHDPNDAGAPASAQVLQQYDNCRHDTMNKKISYAFVPRVAQSLYVPASFSGSVSYGYSANAKGLWIDTAAPSNGTPHYGLKMVIRNFVNISGAGQCWRFQPVYYFCCRRTR